MPSPTGATNNSIDRVRMRRAMRVLAGAAGSARGVTSDPTRSPVELRRALRGLQAEFTADADLGFDANPKDPVRARRAIAQLRRAT